MAEPKLIDRVREIAAEYKVSERTARRYIQRGHFPQKSDERRIGQDGKLYPATRQRRSGRPGTPLKRDLALAYQAMMRVDRKSYADGFYPEDLTDLRLLLRQAEATLGDWEAGISSETK